MRELVDLGLAVFELAVFALDLLVLAGNACVMPRHLGQQFAGERAQLIGVQAVELLRIDHGQQFAKPG